MDRGDLGPLGEDAVKHVTLDFGPEKENVTIQNHGMEEKSVLVARGKLAFATKRLALLVSGFLF